MRVNLLGPLQVLDEAGREVSVGGPKQRAVLALLALNADRVVAIDSLVDGIWGEEPPESAQNSLQVYVHGLRKALGGPDAIRREAPGYRLVGASTDVADADDWRTEARAAFADHDLEAASLLNERIAALWRGDPLADLRSLPFTTYVAVEMEETRLTDLEAANEIYLERAQHRVLVPRLERLVATHPTREALWGQLMVALYRSDRQGDALTAFRRAREALADELGIDPGPRLRELESAVLRQEAWLDPPEVREDAAPTLDESRLPRAPLASNLPRPAHALLGRNSDVDRVAELFRHGVRLVTLTGPGGMGKTRTSVAAAESLLEDFETVRFVDLASSLDAATMLIGIGEAIGIASDDASNRAIAEVLLDRPTLLVLDNLEQVEGSSAAVAEVLTEAPALRLLVTSRRALRVSAEHVHALSPLEAEIGLDLFVARAGLLRPGFAVDDDNRADVVELCRRLDGLPLALEIAAARVRLLSPGDMLRRLDSGLHGLGAGQADLPDRQRSLTATVAWSLDLLPTEVRSLCGRLSVFVDGFTAESAIAVCGPEEPDGVLEGLEALIDASLLSPLEGRGDARFRLFEIVREQVREHLEAEELVVLQDAHARRYAALIDAALVDLDTAGHERSALALRRERANLDAAEGWLLAAGDLDACIGLVGGLTPWWIADGDLRHGLAHIERIIEVAEARAGDQAPGLLACRGLLLYHLTDWAAAIAALDVALAALPADSADAARVECHLGAALLVTGEPERGSVHAESALALAAEHGWYDVRVQALSALAIGAAIAGRFEIEEEFYRERLALVRARGDRARTVDTLSILAEIDVDRADWEAARRHAAEALELLSPEMATERRDTLIVLARIALAQHETGEARSRLIDALEASVGLGQPFGLAQVLRTVAGLAASEERFAEGARLVGASEHLRERVVMSEQVEVDLAGFADAVRMALPPDRYDEEVTAGRSLARADALALAERVLSGSPSEN